MRRKLSVLTIEYRNSTTSPYGPKSAVFLHFPDVTQLGSRRIRSHILRRLCPPLTSKQPATTWTTYQKIYEGYRKHNRNNSKNGGGCRGISSQSWNYSRSIFPNRHRQAAESLASDVPAKGIKNKQVSKSLVRFSLPLRLPIPVPLDKLGRPAAATRMAGGKQIFVQRRDKNSNNSRPWKRNLQERHGRGTICQFRWPSGRWR